jgi:hypothetical protein
MQLISSKLLRPSQILIVGLSTCLATAIVGTAAHVYHTYRSQQAANNPFWLPIWAQYFQTTGAKATIGAASGIAFLNLAYIVIYLVNKVGGSFYCGNKADDQ